MLSTEFSNNKRRSSIGKALRTISTPAGGSSKKQSLLLSPVSSAKFVTNTNINSDYNDNIDFESLLSPSKRRKSNLGEAIRVRTSTYESNNNNNIYDEIINNNSNKNNSKESILTDIFSDDGKNPNFYIKLTSSIIDNNNNSSKTSKRLWLQTDFTIGIE